jgi:hypothetical protein
MTAHSGSQLTLSFEPGLADRHASLLDCVRQVVYAHRNPLKTIAADMDLSQSDLSRKLSGNPDDTRRFSVEDLERLIEATGDVTPVLYLAEKYLASRESKQRAAAEQLCRMLPDIMALIKTLREGA